MINKETTQIDYLQIKEIWKMRSNQWNSKFWTFSNKLNKS